MVLEAGFLAFPPLAQSYPAPMTQIGVSAALRYSEHKPTALKAPWPDRPPQISDPIASTPQLGRQFYCSLTQFGEAAAPNLHRRTVSFASA